MSLRSAQTIAATFTVSSSTGAAVNADSLPTGTLFLNGVSNAATVTVAAALSTGHYKWSVTAPTLAIGDVVEILIAATVSSVAAKEIVYRDSCDALDSATSGTTAAIILALKKMTITNTDSSGIALDIQASGSSGTGINVSAGATGYGVLIGANSISGGTGLQVSGATNGVYVSSTNDAVKIISTSGDGIDASSVGSGMYGFRGDLAGNLYGSVSSIIGTNPAIITRQVGTLDIVQGDSYLSANGNPITINMATGALWPTDLSGGTITFTANRNSMEAESTGSNPTTITASGAIVTATGSSRAVRFDLTAAATAVLSTGTGIYDYDIQWALSSARATLETGAMSVAKQQTTA